MKIWLVTVVGSLMLATSACATTPTTDSPVVPVPQVDQSSASAPTADGSDVATKYFSALASNDPEQEADALALTAPKSVAAAYASHQVAIDNADLDGGSPADPGEVSFDDGTYESCAADVTPGSDDCTRYGLITYSGGKISGFTVNDRDITKRLVLGTGDPVKVGHGVGKVRFLSAYQAASNSLYVTFEFRSDKTMTPNLDDSRYRDPSGRQSQASSTGGPLNELDADSTATGYAVFKGAKPGGVVTLDLYDADYNDHYVKIKTG